MPPNSAKESTLSLHDEGIANDCVTDHSAQKGKSQSAQRGIQRPSGNMQAIGMIKNRLSALSSSMGHCHSGCASTNASVLLVIALTSRKPAAIYAIRSS